MFTSEDLELGSIDKQEHVTFFKFSEISSHLFIKRCFSLKISDFTGWKNQDVLSLCEY